MELPDMDTEIEKIAQTHLFIETLEEKRNDELDFHDLSVGCIREALESAYRAGVAASQR